MFEYFLSVVTLSVPIKGYYLSYKIVTTLVEGSYNQGQILYQDTNLG